MPEIEEATYAELLDGFVNEQGLWDQFIVYCHERGYAQADVESANERLGA